MKATFLKYMPVILWGTGSMLLGTGIAQAGPTETPTPALSKQAVQLNVPFVRQEDPKACGLAVLNMLNGYYNQKLNQAQLEWIRTNSQAGEGVMASELVVVLRAAEYETALFQGTLDKEKTGLYHHLDKKRPVIVMITSKDLKNSHYDLITGYDPVNSLLLLMDPATGPMTVTTDAFNPAWDRAHNFTLVAVPKKDLDATPVPSPAQNLK